MARHYYLTRSGTLRRKDHTLSFTPSADEETDAPLTNEVESATAIVGSIADYEMGDLAAEPDGSSGEDNSDSSLLPHPSSLISSLDEENDAPVKVSERRVIPIEDVDALWVFRELDLNARVLNFLAQKKVPAHFFNYYGFYAGSFYPREYLQAGYLTVRQVRHYTNRKLRMRIAREFIAAAMHNILRNLRYYGTRGIALDSETEKVQTEMLRLEAVKDVAELMGCEGRARAAYYQGFGKILRDRFDFTKRVKRPPDNMVNAMISYTNGLVYAACLSQLYRSQLDPTIGSVLLESCCL